MRAALSKVVASRLLWPNFRMAYNAQCRPASRQRFAIQRGSAAGGQPW